MQAWQWQNNSHRQNRTCWIKVSMFTMLMDIQSIPKLTGLHTHCLVFFLSTLRSSNMVCWKIHHLQMNFQLKLNLQGIPQPAMFDDTGRWMTFAICRCRRLCPCELHQEVLPEPKWAGTIAHWRGCWATKKVMFASVLPTAKWGFANDTRDYCTWFTMIYGMAFMCTSIHIIYTQARLLCSFKCFVIQSRIIIPSDVLFLIWIDQQHVIYFAFQLWVWSSQKDEMVNVSCLWNIALGARLVLSIIAEAGIGDNYPQYLAVLHVYWNHMKSCFLWLSNVI